MDNYKAYSLQELEVWVREAVEADCTPKEIYDSIITTVKSNMKYHRACYRDSVKLLSLLRGSKHEFEIIENNNMSEETAYWEGRLDGKEFEDALNKYGYEYTPKSDPITGNITIETDK